MSMDLVKGISSLPRYLVYEDTYFSIYPCIYLSNPIKKIPYLSKKLSENPYTGITH